MGRKCGMLCVERLPVALVLKAIARLSKIFSFMGTVLNFATLDGTVDLAGATSKCYLVPSELILRNDLKFKL